jgi:hypothetical protein
MVRTVIEAEGDDVLSIAAQIPRAESMAPGSRVVIFPGKARGWIVKMFARHEAPLSALGSALLARGYVRIGAGEEAGRPCVWGEA